MARKASRIGVVVDGGGWGGDLACGLLPLVPSILSHEPWPAWAVLSSDRLYLDWMAGRFETRPLLGVTSKPLVDEKGAELRGAALLGEGVAIVSSSAVPPGGMAGVLQHEMAHAAGLPHCEGGECALEERKWPESLAGRPQSLCPSCQRRYEALCSRWAP